jgi:hypothetical protein
MCVMFLAGGNKKEEVKQGAQGEGFPSSFAAGRGAYEGTNSKEGEQDRRGRTMSIFRLLYMVERDTAYIETKK